MAFHYNTAILKNLLDFFRLKGDELPSQIDEIIVPTFDVSPPVDTILNASANNALSATILTTPTDRDFYMVGCYLTQWKDASSTSTVSTITGFVNGVSCQFTRISSRTLLASTSLSGPFVVFPNPIKMDRNTVIAVTNETNVANISSNGTIYGFYM